MIDRGAIQIKGAASAALADAVAEFLAGGGQIFEAPPLRFVPKPVTVVQYQLTPKPAVRRRPKPEPVLLPQPLPSPVRAEAKPKIDPDQAFRDERDARLAELAKTMTCAECSAHTGIPTRHLAWIAKKRGFSYVNTWKTFRIDPVEDAKRIERIKVYKRIGLTRRQCCLTLCISSTMFRRLLQLGEIDYTSVAKQKRA